MRTGRRSRSSLTSGSIYGLFDPRNNELRYVGLTTQTLAARLAGHVKCKRRCHRNNWIAKLRRLGLKPVIEMLETAIPMADLATAEVRWISFCRRTGCRLLNVSDGGKLVSASTKQRMSAYWTGRPRQRHSAEVRQHLSEIRKGKQVPWLQSSEVKARAAVGVRNRDYQPDEEVRRKISAALTGKPKPLAWRLQMSQRQRPTKSGFPGVGYNRARRKWEAKLKRLGVCTYLGLFATPEAAAEAVRKAAIAAER